MFIFLHAFCSVIYCASCYCMLQHTAHAQSKSLLLMIGSYSVASFTEKTWIAWKENMVIDQSLKVLKQKHGDFRVGPEFFLQTRTRKNILIFLWGFFMLSKNALIYPGLYLCYIASHFLLIPHLFSMTPCYPVAIKIAHSFCNTLTSWGQLVLHIWSPNISVHPGKMAKMVLAQRHHFMSISRWWRNVWLNLFQG